MFGQDVEGEDIERDAHVARAALAFARARGSEQRIDARGERGGAVGARRGHDGRADQQRRVAFQ